MEPIAALAKHDSDGRHFSLLVEYSEQFGAANRDFGNHLADLMLWSRIIRH